MIATPASAQQHWECPIARIRHTASTANCFGDGCPIWRWVPLDMKGAYAEAVSQRMKKGDTHKDAVAWVMENREQLGLATKPTHGYCGLGGEVKA